MSAYDTCRSCGAKILWIRMVSGKWHPVNADPEYALELPGIGRRFFVTEDGKIIRGECCTEHADGAVRAYTSHFATCPNADKHRRR